MDSLVVSPLQDAGGYAISRQNNLELYLGCQTCWLSYFTLVCLWCGRTVAWAGDRSVYGHVITKFSRMGRLLHFLTHGAPLARFVRESSAIKLQQKHIYASGYKRRFEVTMKMDRHNTWNVMWRSDGFPISDWVSLDVFAFLNSGCVTRYALAWPHILLNEIVCLFFFFCLAVPNHFQSQTSFVLPPGSFIST